MKTTNLSKLIAVTFIAVCITFSCSKSNTTTSPSPTPSGAGTAINVSGMAFPASVSIKAGAIVTWTNKDPETHTVTSDDGTSFNSGDLASGASFSFKTITPGTFKYHCNIHANMHGTLVVTQ